ncbi:hypothetical protein IW261DRAFT_1569746 [Armillaria novae-zelandiae]|uniref:Uncharacterized protein n=1 Tax=Armillaria novae-zelandiae TaxID=153914 RepID=A0AA39NWV3_9AGAR|nr:hypothetical protein IW261DRAFT_1569746 [Armillaria novae-zelandiae]
MVCHVRAAGPAVPYWDLVPVLPLPPRGRGRTAGTALRSAQRQCNHFTPPRQTHPVSGGGAFLHSGNSSFGYRIIWVVISTDACAPWDAKQLIMFWTLRVVPLFHLFLLTSATMPRSPPVRKLKNGPAYRRREDYPPPNYESLMLSRKRQKDQVHLNTVLEGTLIIANERKYGSYPTRGIPRKCVCTGFFMLVTNVGANMQVHTSVDLEFNNIGKQFLTCATCHAHCDVESGFTRAELNGMSIISTVLLLRETVANGVSIGPGSALSILLLEMPGRQRQRRIHATIRTSMPAPALGPPNPPSQEIIDLTRDDDDLNVDLPLTMYPFVDIVCWLEDNVYPTYAQVPLTTAGEVDLQKNQALLGEFGIEKVGTFSCYVSALHDWVSCGWSVPFKVKQGALLALRRDGVHNLVDWQVNVPAIIAE